MEGDRHVSRRPRWRKRTCSSTSLHQFPCASFSPPQTVRLTLSQGLTIGIVEGGPCGRTGEGARGDGGASWVLHLLLTAADHTAGNAPGYAPSCWHWYCSTSCWQVSNDSYGQMTPTISDRLPHRFRNVNFPCLLSLPTGTRGLQTVEYSPRNRRYKRREKCETSECVRFRGEWRLLLSIPKIFAQCTRSLDATRNARCFQLVCRSRTVCRSHQWHSSSLAYSQQTPAPRHTRPRHARIIS